MKNITTFFTELFAIFKNEINDIKYIYQYIIFNNCLTLRCPFNNS